jgi:hypothetical protein
MIDLDIIHRAWGNKLILMIVAYKPFLQATSVPDMLDLDYIVGSLIGLSGNRFIQQGSLGNLGGFLCTYISTAMQSIQSKGFKISNQSS